MYATKSLKHKVININLVSLGAFESLWQKKI